MAGKDKDRIKNNIDHCTDQYRIHAHFGKALCRNKGIHTKCQLDEDRPNSINTHVAYRIFDGIGACAKCHQKRSTSKIHHCCQYNGNHNLQGKAVTKNLLCCFLFALSHHDRCSGCSTITNQCRKSGNDHNKGHTYTNTCQCQRAAARNVSNINTVNNIIKHIDHLRCNRWNCQTQQQFADWLFRQKVFLFVHIHNHAFLSCVSYCRI